MEKEKMPKHIAIILDGNRRWAKKNKLPIIKGHSEGAKRVEDLINYAYEIGIPYVTVYAFSTENWKRSEEEVKGLMKLLYKFTSDMIEDNSKKDICIKVYGDKSRLDQKIQKNIETIEEKTRDRKTLTFGICLNYGGRQEIVKSVKEIATLIKDGKIDVEDIDEDMISNHLYTAGIPDPDLVIRTSGEYRTSNFLPWQITYSELYFPENVLWPEFDQKQLDLAIEEYIKRNRRFGGN
ncbi:MAG: polyprenyl diphosphate synthase [Clostridia bacterium]|nr:polyprenyl diphosphate synthase [Clostridia bacterium]